MNGKPKFASSAACQWWADAEDEARREMVRIVGIKQDPSTTYAGVPTVLGWFLVTQQDKIERELRVLGCIPRRAR